MLWICQLVTSGLELEIRKKPANSIGSNFLLWLDAPYLDKDAIYRTRKSSIHFKKQLWKLWIRLKCVYKLTIRFFCNFKNIITIKKNTSQNQSMVSQMSVNWLTYCFIFHSFKLMSEIGRRNCINFLCFLFHSAD